MSKLTLNPAASAALQAVRRLQESGDLEALTVQNPILNELSAAADLWEQSCYFHWVEVHDGLQEERLAILAMIEGRLPVPEGPIPSRAELLMNTDK